MPQPSLLDPASLSADLMSLRIVTCGRPAVLRGGVPVPWPAQSAAEVLWYLHAHPQGVYRARLLCDLWHAEETGAALGRFRVALHRLRGVLGGPNSVLDEGEHRYRLHPDLYARSDVGEQAALRMRAAAPDLPEPERLRLLAEALAAVQGEYLPQIQATWVQPERERVQQQRLALALALAQGQCAARECLCSLGTLQAALTHEPLLDERQHQRLMLCLVTQQGPAPALEHYRRYVRYLRHEVADEPLPATRELAARIREEEVSCEQRKEAEPPSEA